MCMEATARVPEYPGSSSGNLRVGGHVHQLLNLAHALINANTSAPGDSAQSASAQTEPAGPAVPTAPGGVQGFSGVPLGMDVGVLGDAECVQWARDLEGLLRFGQALAVQIAGELAHRVEAGRYASSGVRSPVDMLVQSLSLSAGEAHRRLRLAQAVLPVRDALTGDVAPVAQSVLAQAFFTGEVSQEMGLLLAGFVDEAQRLASNGQISPEVAEEVEEALVDTGREESPDFTRHLGNRIISHLDPDGHKPSHGDLLAKQGLFFRKPRRGLIHFDGHMTIAQHEQLMVAIGTATNPNKHKNINTINTADPNNPAEQPLETVETAGPAGPAGQQDHASTASGQNTGRPGAGGFGGDEGEGCCGAGGQGGGQDGACDHGAEQDPLCQQLQGVFGLFTTTTNPSSPSSPSNGMAAEAGNPATQATDPGNIPATAAPDNDSATEPANDSANGSLSGSGDGNANSSNKAAVHSENPGSGQGSNQQGSNQQGSNQQGSAQKPPVPGPGGFRAGQGWRRPLEAWEIPPRPPNAPAEAVPPVFEGDQWFWFPTPSSNPKGWEPRGQNVDFNIWETTTTPATDPAPEPAPEPNGESSWAPEWQRPAHPDGNPPTNEHTNDHKDHKDHKDDCRNDDRDSQHIEDQDWGVRVVNGVRIPFPGNGEILEGLDPIDPESTDPVVKDDRTRAQKLLDGLLDCVALAARTGKLPLNGGLKTQLIITTTQADLDRRDGTGTAFTTYNGPMPLNLFSSSLCDPQITTMTMGEGAEILNVGRTQRLFTPAQRKLLFARDLGCSFPDCTAIAPWTEAHHITPWQQGGETNINNAALLCSHHHTLLHNSNWNAALINGTPHYTAPYLLDPQQTPRRNNYHHGLPKKPVNNSDSW